MRSKVFQVQSNLLQGAFLQRVLIRLTKYFVRLSILLEEELQRDYLETKEYGNQLDFQVNVQLILLSLDLQYITNIHQHARIVYLGNPCRHHDHPYSINRTRHLRHAPQCLLINLYRGPLDPIQTALLKGYNNLYVMVTHSLRCRSAKFMSLATNTFFSCLWLNSS